MTAPLSVGLGGAPKNRRKPVVPSSVLAMIMFVLTEIMMFAGLISAFAIVRTHAPGGMWPPPGQPRLPVEETAFNTAALILSGVLLYFAQRAFARKGKTTGRLLLASILLGALFVALQGREWVEMLGVGLTMTSSTHGSFFYLIVGVHGVHAVVALGAMAWAWLRSNKGALLSHQLWTVAVFWYFVVGVWPFLYVRVYW
jgi:heme/copper-type cytochrome/quinol oxidase subunit 3